MSVKCMSVEKFSFFVFMAEQTPTSQTPGSRDPYFETKRVLMPLELNTEITNKMNEIGELISEEALIKGVIFDLQARLKDSFTKLDIISSKRMFLTKELKTLVKVTELQRKGNEKIIAMLEDYKGPQIVKETEDTITKEPELDR